MEYDRFANPSKERQRKRGIRNVGASGPEMETAKRQRTEDRGWHNTQPNINDLPPELLLLISSGISVRDLCIIIAPVCTRWRLLAKHPSLWTELSFVGNHVSTQQASELLHASPILKELALTDRYDSDAILQEVCTSNQRIQTIEVKGCREKRTKNKDRYFYKDSETLF
jgi:hypothetical protein